MGPPVGPPWLWGLLLGQSQGVLPLLGPLFGLPWGRVLVLMWLPLWVRLPRQALPRWEQRREVQWVRLRGLWWVGL